MGQKKRRPKTPKLGKRREPKPEWKLVCDPEHKKCKAVRIEDEKA